MAPTAPQRVSSRKQGSGNSAGNGIGNGTSTGGGGGRSPHPPPEAFNPAADTQTYRDLLIFEERLKQNAARLVKRKKKYQTFLVLLCAAICFFSYNVFLDPQEGLPLHYLNVTILLVTATMLFLFFASGMYAERITSANKFVPQSNRSLRNFNMYLNLRKPSRRRYFPFLSGNSSSSDTPAMIPTMPVSKSAAALRNLNDNNMTIGQVRQEMSRQAGAARRTQIAAIPPTSNPRGELIFSPKVSLQFREGYERYRAAFERRRKQKLEERRWNGWRRWWILAGFGSGNNKSTNNRDGPSSNRTGEKGAHRQGTSANPALAPARSSPRKVRPRRDGQTTPLDSLPGSEMSSRASSRASSPSASILQIESQDEGAAEEEVEVNLTPIEPSRGRSELDEDSTMSQQRRGRDRTPSVTALSTNRRVTRSSSARNLQQQDQESHQPHTQDNVPTITVEEEDGKAKTIAPDPISVASSADDRSAPEATLREPEGDVDLPVVQAASAKDAD